MCFSPSVVYENVKLLVLMEYTEKRFVLICQHEVFDSKRVLPINRIFNLYLQRLISFFVNNQWMVCRMTLKRCIQVLYNALNNIGLKTRF